MISKVGMRAIPEATEITLSAEERRQLEALSRSTKSQTRMRFRARVVLLAAEGTSTREISRRLHCTIGTAWKWRVRYARDRLAGLSEVGNRGAAPKYGTEHQQRILAMLDRPPTAGYSNWAAPLLARALGDVHEQYIWRFLRAQKIDLSGGKSWCESNDPEFVAKAADIVGLYMMPPACLSAGASFTPSPVCWIAKPSQHQADRCKAEKCQGKPRHQRKRCAGITLIFPPVV